MLRPPAADSRLKNARKNAETGIQSAASAAWSSASISTSSSSSSGQGMHGTAASEGHDSELCMAALGEPESKRAKLASNTHRESSSAHAAGNDVGSARVDAELLGDAGVAAPAVHTIELLQLIRVAEAEVAQLGQQVWGDHATERN